MAVLSIQYLKNGTARGQSEILGYILIFSIMIAGAGIIVGLGVTAINDTERGLSDDRAEKALTQFDSKAGLVALGEADSQQVSFATEAGEQFRVNEDDGWMAVTVENRSSEVSEDIMNVTLGSLTYTNEGTKLAYQGGGVWRADASGGSMISPPEFHYRNGTLTLPAVTVTGDVVSGGDMSIRQAGETSIFPTSEKEDRLNPLEEHRVDVTVQSEYYRGWGQYFMDRTDGDVEFDHERNIVVVTLVSPVDVDEVTAASASLSAGGEFSVYGTSASSCDGAGDVYTDSYDSSDGPYCEQFKENDEPPAWNGDVVYGKDVDISDGSGGSNFYGDVVSGQTVTVDDSEGSGQPEVYGNISYVDDCITDREEESGDCSKRIANESGGQVFEIDRVETANSIDWYIDTVVEEIAESPDEKNPEIAGERLDDGEYYFDELTLSDDERLELDTTDGDIFIAVDGAVRLHQDAEIEVIGTGEVQLFVRGDGVSGNHLQMDNDATIGNDEDNATRFRVYGTADFDAVLGGGGSGNLAQFNGVIYAPPGRHGTGSVTLDGGEIYGGILSGTTAIDGGSIHYDEALQDEQIISSDARIIKVTYLHVTENRIHISGR